MRQFSLVMCFLAAFSTIAIPLRAAEPEPSRTEPTSKSDDVTPSNGDGSTPGALSNLLDKYPGCGWFLTKRGLIFLAVVVALGAAAVTYLSFSSHPPEPAPIENRQPAPPPKPHDERAELLPGLQKFNFTSELGKPFAIAGADKLPNHFEAARKPRLVIVPEFHGSAPAKERLAKLELAAQAEKLGLLREGFDDAQPLEKAGDFNIAVEDTNIRAMVYLTHVMAKLRRIQSGKGDIEAAANELVEVLSFLDSNRQVTDSAWRGKLRGLLAERVKDRTEEKPVFEAFDALFNVAKAADRDRATTDFLRKHLPTLLAKKNAPAVQGYLQLLAGHQAELVMNGDLKGFHERALEPVKFLSAHWLVWLTERRDLPEAIDDSLLEIVEEIGDQRLREYAMARRVGPGFVSIAARGRDAYMLAGGDHALGLYLVLRASLDVSGARDVEIQIDEADFLRALDGRPEAWVPAFRRDFVAALARLRAADPRLR